jgi:pimeloyl-ACP methyl ester carboxylesterase
VAAFAVKMIWAIGVAAGLALGGCATDHRPRAATSAAKVEVRLATIEGVSIAYYERGSGTPLLMNMGSASTMSEWDPALLARLARRYRLIIYDYRGIGLSSRIPRSGLTIEKLADDAVALLDHLKIAKAHVLGWSLGGFVTQQIAIRHPERVERIVLAATNPGGSQTVFGPLYAQRIDSDPSATEEQVLSVNFPRTRRGKLAARSFLRRVERGVDSGEVPNDFSVPRSGYDAQLGAERRWGASNANYRRLPAITAPALVATGQVDVLTPPANSRRLAERMTHSRLVLFRHAGHAFLFQDRARFAKLVERFLG